MRRRRQKNPVLGRIIAVSILVHIILLPILAYFGAFKKIQEHFVQTQMVVLPPPEVAKEKPIEKKETKVKKTAVASKSKSSASHAQAHASHSNVPQPHIAVAAGDKGGDSGPAVEEGSGKVGVVPIDPNAGKPVGTTETTKPVEQPAKNAVTEQPKTEKPVVIAPVKPVEQPRPPVVEMPVTPKAPVFTAAQPIDDSQPKPSIPDDLRSDAIDKTVVVECTVGEDGSPMQVKAVQSTGNDELDRRALDAAKKWRFKPATKDGQPVIGKVRIFIEFQVS
ncbi:MAG: TonB family protein [Chthonomonadaceae bacterium]|nr:TonB family protein [Chthonomonadaceae bacterium]